MISFKKEDELDIKELKELIVQFWKEKFLILAITILCLFLAYLYTFTLRKEFRIVSTINYPNARLFDNLNLINIYALNSIIVQNINETSAKELEVFKKSFDSNLLSFDNFDIFLEQNNDKKYDDFKIFLKKKKIKAKEYFENNRFAFLEEKKYSVEKKNLDKFFFIFPPQLEGEIFLNDYIEFIKNKTATEFIDNKKKIILSSIIFYERQLEYAKNINLKDQMFVDDKSLYLKGEKLLSIEISYFKKYLNSLNIDMLKYDAVKYNTLKPQLIMKKTSTYLFAGAIFGFFLSLMIIYFKSILKER
jgi:LPS O-antigen subunit length determinant protein (WzzB/FepE family)